MNEKKLTSAESFIKYSVSIGALELVPEGRKLKSGRISPFFFNSGAFNTGESIDRLAHAYTSALNTSFRNKVDVLFGPAYKGIPLSVAVAMKWASLSEHRVGYAFNRKEAKDHGERGTVIGMPLTDKRVLIIDDVITTGESKREAVEIIRAHGGTLVGCVIAFDRQEKGYDPVNKTDIPISAAQEFESIFGVPLVAAATLDDLISILLFEIISGKSDNIITIRESANKILTYRRQYERKV